MPYSFFWVCRQLLYKSASVVSTSDSLQVYLKRRYHKSAVMAANPPGQGRSITAWLGWQSIICWMWIDLINIWAFNAVGKDGIYISFSFLTVFTVEQRFFQMLQNTKAKLLLLIHRIPEQEQSCYFSRSWKRKETIDTKPIHEQPRSKVTFFPLFTSATQSQGCSILNGEFCVWKQNCIM